MQRLRKHSWLLVPQDYGRRMRGEIWRAWESHLGELDQFADVEFTWSGWLNITGDLTDKEMSFVDDWIEKTNVQVVAKVFSEKE